MSFLKQAAILGTILLAGNAAAHGFIQGISAGGKSYAGQSHWSSEASPGWKANNGDTGFASSLTGPDIICHNSAVAGTQYVAVAAGSAIEVTWNTWPESHKGPVLDYLAPCGDDCATIDKSQLRFTKIDEAGLITANPQRWASDDLIADNFKWTVTIPSSVAPGKYVLRHETIALHSAGSQGGAQAYPQCINIEVSGSGTNSLSSGTPGTQLYNPTEPGILVNIYTTMTGYDIPGPAVMAGGSSDDSGSPPVPSSSSRPPRLSSTTLATSTRPVSITRPATTKIAVVSTTTDAPPTTNPAPSFTSTSAAPFTTFTMKGRKFVCHEE